MPLGYEFQPDEEKRLRRGLNQPGQFSPGVSDAIKVLSLRLPNVLGGRPMAPDDLLRPQVGGGGGSMGAVPSSLMRSTGLGDGPVPAMGESGGANSTPLSAPASQPFSTMRPGASAGAGESAQLDRLMGSALGGGSNISSRPTPHITPSYEPIPGDAGDAGGGGYPGDDGGQGRTPPTFPSGKFPPTGGADGGTVDLPAPGPYTPNDPPVQDNGLNAVLEFLLQRRPDGGGGGGMGGGGRGQQY